MTSEFVLDVDRSIMLGLLQKAEERLGLTYPNPVTAAAVVVNGQIISEGIHQSTGSPHAEVLALESAGDRAKGADLYVTLEPCTHHGRTPPCVQAIIRSGIRRVIFAMSDPNPLVQLNRASAILQAEGIAVVQGVCAKEAVLQNAPFVVNQVLNRPFVTLKVGASLDGKIALSTGQSRYLTGKDSLLRVHQLRREVDAIIVGMGTVQMDNPSLTIRHGVISEGKVPYKIILDPNAEWKGKGALVDSNPNEKLVWCIDQTKDVLFVPTGVQVWRLPVYEGFFSWAELLDLMYKRLTCCHVLLEGGAGVYSSAFSKGIIDRFMVFVAPKILGGRSDFSWLSTDGFSSLSEVTSLVYPKFEPMGSDCLISGYHPDALRYLQSLLAEDTLGA